MSIMFYSEYACTGSNYHEVTQDLWPGDWERLGLEWYPRSCQFSGKCNVNGVVLSGDNVCVELSSPFEIVFVHMEN